MKRIAIVTGASSGMGRRFAQTAAENVSFDELWVIARREERLLELKKELSGQTVIPIAMDLSVRENISSLGERLKKEDAEVVLLVNAAGFGKFQAVTDVSQDDADRMLALNCGALMTCVMFVCRTCIEERRF